MTTCTSPSEMMAEYDYVVVGGGTSGLVVASRLTEDSSVRVVVLEAGMNRLEDPRVNIPAMAFQVHGTELDWRFQTTPQENLQNRPIQQPQGRMLGGSSGINNQAFIAPSAAGIDAWGAMGSSGWDWKTLAPYYRKFHTLKLPDESTAAHLGLDYADVEVNGTDGPIQASYTGVVLDPLSKAWVDTFKAIRYGVRSDPFSGKALGGYANPSTVNPKTKTRSYSASAYYAPADQRPNLHVFVGAEVVKIGLVSQPDQDVLADHVNFVIDGTNKSINARKEVILAAGVFQSPKLLELSGIGNSEILESIGVPTLIPNRNVGENLQDHLMAGISYEVQPGVMTGDSLMRQEPEQVEAAMKMYSKQSRWPSCCGGHWLPRDYAITGSRSGHRSLF